MLSQEALEANLVWSQRKRARLGIVTGFSKNGGIRVQWDGLKSHASYHPTFIAPVPSATRIDLDENEVTWEQVRDSVATPIVSLEHGYLWIGGEHGPCLVSIAGKATLLKIADMIQRGARDD